MEMKNFTITKRDGSKDRFSLDKNYECYSQGIRKRQ